MASPPGKKTRAQSRPKSSLLPPKKKHPPKLNERRTLPSGRKVHDPDKPFGDPDPDAPVSYKIEIPEDQYEKLAFCVRIGLTFDDVAMIFDMSRITLRRRLHEDEKLMAVYKKAKSEAHAYVANKLFDHIARGNLPAIIFYLKVQAKWYERQVVEHTLLDELEKNSDEFSELLPQLTDDELETLQRIMTAAEQRARAMGTSQPTGKPN